MCRGVRNIFDKKQLKQCNPPKSVLSIIGLRFGNLVVIEFAGKNKWQKPLVLCKCDCGNITFVSPFALKNGKSLSCGCLRWELFKKNRIKHGYARSKGKRHKIYTTWKSMISRCYNKKVKAYPRYGGRGIVVCENWKCENGFINFKNDMGEQSDNRMTIDRINNDFGYTCGKCAECIKNGWSLNCRWVDMKTQSNNRKNTRFIEYNGVKITYSDLSDKLKISISSVAERIKNGWTPEEMLNNKRNK